MSHTNPKYHTRYFSVFVIVFIRYFVFCKYLYWVIQKSLVEHQLKQKERIRFPILMEFLTRMGDKDK